MTERERYLRYMHYQPVDYPPLRLVGAWPDTLRRWYTEGLPAGVDPHRYLGVRTAGGYNVSGETQMYPWVETKVLQDNEDHTIEIDGWGRTVRKFKNASTTPEWIDYPVKCPDDLRTVIDSGFAVDQASLDARYPEDWEERTREAGESGKVVSINVGWYYWSLRSLAGVELASYLFYDAPELVDELFERINIIALDGIRRAAALTHIDNMIFGEDIAYKNGPLISPEMNRRYIVPRYRKITELSHSVGCDIAVFGSDGDLTLLIPDLLKAGVNCPEPCEVAAGMHPVELRKRFGRDLLLMGGLDKREIAKGPKAIDAEIARNMPVVEDGGYQPTIDHSVSSDISWANYCYFIEAIHKALGVPGD